MVCKNVLLKSNLANAVINQCLLYSTHRISQTGENIENKLGHILRGVVICSCVGFGTAQLVPVAPDVEVPLPVPRLAVFSAGTVWLQAVPFKANYSPCVQPEQSYSSRYKQHYQIVVVSKAGRLKAHRLF